MGSSYRTNQTEFAVGIMIACVGVFLLYTDYKVGYWGVLALGVIFVIKNLPNNNQKNISGTTLEKRRTSDKMTKDRLNN